MIKRLTLYLCTMVFAYACSGLIPALSYAKEYNYFKEEIPYSRFAGIEPCLYKNKDCVCCAWVDYINSKSILGGTKKNDLFFVGRVNDIKEIGNYEILIFAPLNREGLLRRAVGCGAKAYARDCMEDLGFKVILFENTTDGIIISAPIDTNGFLYYPTHNFYIYFDDLKPKQNVAFPLVCVEKSPSGSTVLIAHMSMIKVFERSQNCASFYRDAKFRFFNFTYGTNWPKD